VRLRWRYVLLVAMLGLAAAVLPAIASSETSPLVEATNTPGSLYSEEHHAWTPSQVSVMAGGVVTFSNSSEVPHGIEWRSALKPTCEEGAGKVPVGTTPTASGTKWTGTCTFSQAGTYTFYCTVHGPEMTGTITVGSDGATTVTTTTTPTASTPSTTPAPKVQAPAGSPFSGTPSLRASQRGTSVHGSLEISQAGAGGRLEVDLLANSATLAKATHGKRVTVGRLLRSSVRAGLLPFVVKLDAKARRALSHRRRLALTVRLVLTPLTGEPTTLIRTVALHG
jgi:plastocyanin